jgi:hypothetical protein
MEERVGGEEVTKASTFKGIPMEILKTYTTSSWQSSFSSAEQIDNTQSLENGRVLFFPELSFTLTDEEQSLLTPDDIAQNSKNISFNKNNNEIRGVAKSISSERLQLLNNFFNRFVTHAQGLINNLLPHYHQALILGRTSFRPVEVQGRPSSYRKDDTRLHVDAFPANPNHGWRILRVFSNINPNQQPRIWRLGESFEDVVKQFLPTLRSPLPGSATLLQLLNITKKRRTLYDHMMLQLHDHMKANETYQRQAQQQEMHFPANSTWVVQTDHVSHAAMSGQYLLEQTFYLPVHAMLNEEKSPLRVLERILQKKLV